MIIRRCSRKKELQFPTSGRPWNRCATRRGSKKGRLHARRWLHLLPCGIKKLRHPHSIDLAVLYRQHSHRDELVHEFAERGIPFTIEGLDVLDTPEVRDVLACLTAAVSPNDAARP